MIRHHHAMCPRRTFAWVLALAVLAPFSLRAQDDGNLLGDPGFEGRVNEPFSTNWTRFGNAFCEFVTPRTGSYVCKLFGNFENRQNWSGVYQDVPASPGGYYQASAYMRQNSKDHLQGGNRAWIKLEFYSAGCTKLLKAHESTRELHVKSAANQWTYFSTGRVKAPKDAAVVRFALLFEQQADNAGGAALFDDVCLREVP
ncbi:MAG: hypothetical protein JXB04_08165 [Kiritimatiellae bacterium]|nr:hypothetical protein [Kiritimatiellia bacterium]